MYVWRELGHSRFEGPRAPVPQYLRTPLSISSSEHVDHLGTLEQVVTILHLHCLGRQARSSLAAGYWCCRVLHWKRCECLSRWSVGACISDENGELGGRNIIPVLPRSRSPSTALHSLKTPSTNQSQETPAKLHQPPPPCAVSVFRRRLEIPKPRHWCGALFRDHTQSD